MYYIGFLYEQPNKMMLFRSNVRPTISKYSFFGKVIGPFTESEAKTEMRILRDGYGYRENPAKSERQRKFMCADLGRLRSGKKTETGMREDQLRDFCRKNPDEGASPTQQKINFIRRVGAKLHGKEWFIRIADTLETKEDIEKAYKELKDVIKLRKISASQIKRGTEHELEHTTDRVVARKIAMDHLREDPYYYTHLAKMEKQYKKNVMSPEKALRLTRKVIAHAKDIYKDYKTNPGQEYHDRKFLAYMTELEKYKIGSPPYIATLAKAYEHLESAKDSMHEKVR